MSEDSSERQMRANLAHLHERHRSYARTMAQLFGADWFNSDRIEVPDAAAPQAICRSARRIQEEVETAYIAEMGKEEAIGLSLSLEQQQEYLKALTDFSQAVRRGFDVMRNFLHAMIAKGQVGPEFLGEEYFAFYGEAARGSLPSSPTTETPAGGQEDIWNYDVGTLTVGIARAIRTEGNYEFSGS